MASVSVNYNCGCGFKTKSLEEAVRHSDEKNHILTALGLITPKTKKK